MKRQTKAGLSEGPQEASSEGAEVTLSEGVQVILEHSNKGIRKERDCRNWKVCLITRITVSEGGFPIWMK